MTRQELATASDLLASAAEDSSGDDADRLADLSAQLDTLAERDTDPDHGRLARIESALGDVQSDASDDVAATIDDALDAIHDFRETIEGV
ncbi:MULTISPECIES: DUF7553 family protein [Salinibaculum]|uniref:DUF7553 family protein n=1 Tax=Salinibaculum TaxID=2732368 RepID=UPI0030D31CF9